MKKLPARAASRGQYVFWFIIATFIATIGLIMTKAGSPIGLAFFVGAIFMVMRETSLRREWKRRQKNNEVQT